MEQGLYLCLCNALRIHSFNVLVFYFSHYLKKICTKRNAQGKIQKLESLQKVEEEKIHNHLWYAHLGSQPSTPKSHLDIPLDTMPFTSSSCSYSCINYEKHDAIVKSNRIQQPAGSPNYRLVYLIKEPPSRDVHLIANHPLVVQSISEG